MLLLRLPRPLRLNLLSPLRLLPLPRLLMLPRLLFLLRHRLKMPKASLKANPKVTIPIFLIIIGATMAVVVWSAKQTKSASDFYTAGGGITGTQNGWAIAGDYMSAASFLGISGMISLYGYDGFMYSVGWLVAYITVLLIVAEPCRNAGKYTLGDILSFRTEPKPVRAVAAISTVAVSTFYLTAQMVGAGKLMQLLIGVPYKTAIIGVGILMVGYVVFGGMTATTWVQIIKAGLLMTGACYSFDPGCHQVRLQPAAVLQRHRHQPEHHRPRQAAADLPERESTPVRPPPMPVSASWSRACS